MKNNQSNYYYWDISIQTILILTIILVPTFFTTSIYNSFTTEKMMIFRCGTLLMAALTIIKLVYYRSDKKTPWQFWLVPLLGLVGIISTFTGINPEVSLWGIHLRMDGLVNMLFLVVFFGEVYWQIDTKVKFNQVLWAVALGSIIPAGYALIQKMGGDPIDWKGVVVEERVFGTTGNPAYLGAYLLFTIPISFYLGAIGNWWQKAGWWAWTVLQVVIIIFTWTRASYLAAGAEVLLLTLTYCWWQNKQRAAQIIAFCAVAVIIFVGALNINHNLVKAFGNNRYIERIANIAQTTDGTGKDRLEMWKVAEKAIAERPMFGSGLSQYIQYFNKYYPNYMDARNENDRYSNYSHNLWLDTAVAHGLVGAGLLLAIYLIFFGLGIYQINQENNFAKKYALAVILIGLSGYLIQAFFNIEIIITWVYSYLFLGLALAAASRLPDEQNIDNRPVELWKQAGVTLTTAAVLGGVYYLSYAPLLSDRLYFQINSTNTTNEDKIELAKKAADLTPYFEYSYIRLGDLYTSAINLNKPDEAESIYNMVIEQVNKAMSINPLNYKNYMSLATIYGSWAKIDDSKMKDSDKYFTTAIPFSPNRLGLYWTWGNTYLSLGELKEAKEKYKQAESINADIGETYYYLAKISYLEGNVQEGSEYLKEATKKKYIFDTNQFYSDTALLAYQLHKLDIAKQLAQIANKSKVTETTAMVEIQANIELDNTEAAMSLLEQYDKSIPGLKNKFVKK